MTKKMFYPFACESDQDIPNHQLVTRALIGDRKALDTLVERHHPWIYNIAFRMVLKHEDAEDIAQDIIIKMVTRLSTYDQEKASFQTWLYRITVNHVINMKTRSFESSVKGLDDYYAIMNSLPDEEPENSPEMQLMVSDLSIGCLEGVFLCLDRRQRVVFILSIAFNVTDKQGSEIMEISKENFRKILSRARSKLFQYMNVNCGAFNEKGSCKCRNKISGLVKAGAFAPDKIKFARPGGPTLKEVIQNVVQVNDRIHSQFVEIYREHPFYEPPDIIPWLRDLLKQDEFKEIFLLNE